MANVLVFAEVRGGELRKVAFEAVTAARNRQPGRSASFSWPVTKKPMKAP